MDKQLLNFFTIIINRDRKQLSQHLKSNPALATTALKIGASRDNAKRFFRKEIMHYTYAGDTALHIAAAAHWSLGVKLLVKSGAPINAKNRHHQTPLHYACSGGPDNDGPTPTAQSATIQALIDAGANPNAQAKGNVTPLHTAIRNRCTSAVAALIQAGASTTIPNKRGSTPTHLANVNSGRPNSGTPSAKAEQIKILALLATQAR